MKKKGLVISICVLGAVLLVLSSVAVSGFFGLIREESKERRAKQREVAQRARESATLLQDWRKSSTCINVPEIPSGKSGDFCVILDGGVTTKRINPPPGTFTEISLSAPGGEITFFDYYGKSLGIITRDGPDGHNCFPRGWETFTITLKEKGSVRMFVGGQRRTPGLSKCS